MGAAIEIVRFRLWHLRRILEIEKRSFPKAAYPKWMFLELYRDCADLFFVARRGRLVAGYSVTCVTEGEAEIISIAVLPEHRCAGVGETLMKRTLESLAERRVRKASLMVRVSNTDALRFYRRLGFRVRGRVARYYENGEDGFLMSRLV